jgi:2-haloacid dehalogenase
MTTKRLENIEACVFDAYGTLFDVNAAAARCAEDLGDTWQDLANTWRLKQLQYTWLRSLMQRHTDFWQVTGDALDYAMETHGVDDAPLRQRLMDLYLTLDAYEEVAGVLATLKGSGLKTAILSNGSPNMLKAAADNAGISASLDAIISVEAIKIFKPHPSVYQMAIDTLGVQADRISFQSSNAWDASAAATFGFRVVWINRFGQARERLPDDPDVEIKTLHDLPAVVGAA